MDRTEQRFERFAQLRAAYPDHDYEDIMARIHDEEVNEAEAAEGRRILEAIENPLEYEDINPALRDFIEGRA